MLLLVVKRKLHRTSKNDTRKIKTANCFHCLVKNLKEEQKNSKSYDMKNHRQRRFLPEVSKFALDSSAKKKKFVAVEKESRSCFTKCPRT